ncbi:MAG: hypothetical protein LKG19_15165 [Saprospiraceae bacterium]|jgi:hypothetical protein|nr:hypothetical protein [Saprospiraceae bacterium]
MTNLFYPTIQERYRSYGVSIEAQYVSQNVQSTHDLFIGQSIFIRAMYNQQLKKKFELYSSLWKKETMFSSSSSEITNNAAYRSIIGLGTDIIPFIIHDLQQSENHWFYALEQLTGENPISNDHIGVIKLMKSDWLNWAEINI